MNLQIGFLTIIILLGFCAITFLLEKILEELQK